MLSAISKSNLIPALRILEQNPEFVTVVDPKTGKETKQPAEPRKALCFGASLSLICIMMGKLDAVAPFISMSVASRAQPVQTNQD